MSGKMEIVAMDGAEEPRVDPEDINTAFAVASQSASVDSYDYETDGSEGSEKRRMAVSGHTYEEFALVLLFGMCLSFSSGFMNGCCLSGFNGLSPYRQSVAGFTGAYTQAALKVAVGDGEGFGDQFTMILSFICGSFICGFLIPRRKPWDLGPEYGPVFLVGSVMLALSCVFGYTDSEGKTLFYFVAMANGLQNGMSSMYSGNLIRTTHLTGTSTDIGLIMGQITTGNYANVWKLYVLLGLTLSFFLGSIISYSASEGIGFSSLIFNACIFFATGCLYCWYVTSFHGISMWQALTGSWEWDKVMSHLNMWDMDETDIVDFFAEIDEDHNGNIDSLELAAALTLKGFTVQQSQIEQMIKAADIAGDGQISKGEWIAMVMKKKAEKKRKRDGLKSRKTELNLLTPPSSPVNTSHLKGSHLKGSFKGGVVGSRV